MMNFFKVLRADGTRWFCRLKMWGVLGGIVVVISGIVKMFTVAPTGMLLLGCGCLMAAAGLLLLMLAVWIIGGVLPKLIRWIVGIFRKLFHRGGEGV